MNDTFPTIKALEQKIAQLQRRVNELESESVRVNATLKESDTRYRILFDNAPGAIFIADAETGILVNANVAAEKLLQKSRDKIIGMHYTALHAPDRATYVQSVFKALTQPKNHNKLERISGTVYRSDGTKVPVEITLRLITLNNRLHLMGVFHDVSERKAMESALRRSEILFRRLVEEARDGIFVIDESGKIIVFNAAQEKINGFTAEKVIGTNAIDVRFSVLSPERQTPETYQYLKSAMEQVLTTGEHPHLDGIHDYQFVDENDETHTVQESVFTIKTDKGYKLIGFDRDITGEVKLQTQYRVMAEAVAQSRDAIVITDNEGVITYVNSGFETVTGYTLAEALGKTPRILKSNFQTEEYYENLWAIILAGRVFKGYIINRRKDDTLYTEDKAITPIVDKQGNITHFVSVGREVSEITKIQNELIESRTRYGLAISAGKVGVWDWDFEKGGFYIDPHLKAMLGYKDAEIANDVGAWLKLIHPDDMGKVIASAEKYRQGAVTKYESTHRVFHKDGSVRWFLARGSAMRDKQGVIYRMFGTDTDITELVKARQAEKVQRLQSETMQEVALALISHTDMSTVLDEILAQAKRLVNYTTANIALFSSTQLSIVRAIGYEKFDCADFIQHLSYDSTGHAVHTNVVEQKKALILTNTHANPIWHIFETTAWIKSYIGIPIMLRNEVIGVLQLDSEHTDTFSKQDAERLQPLANAAAIALENARLYGQTRKDAETNRVLLREVNHRVKNNLAALIGLLYIEKRAHPKFSETMDDVINRVRSMATAHQMLSATKWEPILLSRLIEQIIRSISQTQSGTRYLFAQVTPSSVRVTANQANNIALIINELTTNVAKHARHPDSDAPSQILQIGVDIQEDGENIMIEFMDNGTGFPPSVLDAGEVNVGLDLVKNMVKGSLVGAITFSNNHGAIAKIEFPMAVSD